MKKKQWIIDGVAYETEQSASEKEKMMSWNYRPLPGYRNPTDEADLDWQNRRDYLRSPEYENHILDAASTITARRAAEKRSQAAKLRKQRLQRLKRMLFDEWMLGFAAFAGLMLWLGFASLQEAHHTGPGYITYYEGTGETELLSESEYRLHYRVYAEAFIFIGICIGVGVIVKGAREMKAVKRSGYQASIEKP